MHRASRAVVTALAAAACFACDSGREELAVQTPGAASPAPGNLLVNPGFEAGREGWSWRESSPYWKDFVIADGPAHSGARSAHLPLHQDATYPARSVAVYGVVQEPTPEAFPERLAGFYRVDRWEKESPQTDLYVQVVVIVWGDPRTPTLVDPLGRLPQLRNYQIRYYLAGLPEPAFRLRNAKIEILSKEPPARGVWVPFDIPIREDFQRLWGVVPANFESIRVLFEARFDNRPAGTTAHADVYYDDLFFGSR